MRHSGGRTSQRGHVDDDRFLGRPGDHHDGLGIRGGILLAVRNMRRHPHVVSRRRLQPGYRSARRVADNEHRVTGHHVDAGFRFAVVMVARRHAGRLAVRPIHSAGRRSAHREWRPPTPSRRSARWRPTARPPGSAAGSRRGRLYLERHRVDAPALVGGHLVAFTGEHVTEVGVAGGAPHLGADRPERAVLDEHHHVPDSDGW